MDKYEFNIKVEQMRKQAGLGDFGTAMKIADGIDWRRVQNVGLLTQVSEIYEKNGEYGEAKEILLLAFERAPTGKGLLYKLTELALKDHNVQEAEAYYREFYDLAPDDSRQYILRYQILKEKDAPTTQLIQALERYTQLEYDEEWMYELAELYHRAGRSEECVRTCDRIMLMFGTGPYVEKAIELKTEREGRELTEYQKTLVRDKAAHEARLRMISEEYARVNAAPKAEEKPEEAPGEEDGAEEMETEAAQPEEEPVRGEEPAAAAPEIEAPAAEIPEEDDELMEETEFPAPAAPVQSEAPGPKAAEISGKVDATDAEAVAAALALALNGGLPKTEPAPAKPKELKIPGAVNFADLEPIDDGAKPPVQDEIDAEIEAHMAALEEEIRKERARAAEAARMAAEEPEDFEDDEEEEDDAPALEEAAPVSRPEPVPETVVKEAAPEEKLPEPAAVPEARKEAVKPAAVKEAPAAVGKPSVEEQYEAEAPVKAAGEEEPEKAAVPVKAAAAEVVAEAAAEAEPAPAKVKTAPAAEAKETATPAAEAKQEPSVRVYRPAAENPDAALPDATRVLPRIGKTAEEETVQTGETRVLPDIRALKTERAAEAAVKTAAKAGRTPGSFNALVEGKTDEEGLAAAVRKLKEIHAETGVKNAAAKIKAGKLNARGILKSADKIAGRDLIIEEAGDLTEQSVKELLQLVEDDAGSRTILLVDNPLQLSRLASANPDLLKVFGTDAPLGPDYAKTPAKPAAAPAAKPEEKKPAAAASPAAKKEAAVKKETAAKKEAPAKKAKQEPKKTAAPANAVKAEAKPAMTAQERAYSEEELDIDAFAHYASNYAKKIDCVITGKSMLALYERIEIMQEDGVQLTRKNAEALIEEAADSAENPPLMKKLGGIFAKKYDKDGMLILKEDDFIS